MIKMLFLLTAKPGMSRDAFIERYESKHVAASLQLVPFYTEYRRSFLLPESMIAVSHVGPAAQRPEFDVVTELWFSDQAAVERMQQEIVETDAGELLAEDERHQFDRRKMLSILAEEHVTPAERLMPPPQPGMKPAVKMICTMRRRPGMTRDEFIDYYETGHAELAMKILVDDRGRCVFGQYRRTFPLPGGVTQIGDADAPPYAYDFDVMTEIWFWTEEDYKAFHALTTTPEVGKALSEDEAKLFDMPHTVMFLADERISTPEECAEAQVALMARKAAQPA